VEVGVEPRDEGVAIRVTDTGPGVPSESAPYLFDEFYQAKAHRRDPGKGFGMGLAICRSLARQLGGEVRLASTGPAGSSFELMLTGVSARPQASAPATSTQP
jgi:two-component system sensor histidine kinase HupT/HoxJ